MTKLAILLIISLIFRCDSFTKNDDHLFFLHNRYMESHDLKEYHEVYGRMEYHEIIKAFEANGFIVHSEIREKDADPQKYAYKIKKQIDSLLLSGVDADHITVVGTSKGGYIAQYVSTFLANSDVNFVFLASVMKGDEKTFPEINFCGNILNIYDLSDTSFVSAIKRKETTNLKISRFKDYSINTGLSHGFLFKAMDEWIEPASFWGKRQYKKIEK